MKNYAIEDTEMYPKETLGRELDRLRDPFTGEVYQFCDKSLQGMTGVPVFERGKLAKTNK